MPEQEIWLTAIFNDHLAGLANAILGALNIHAQNPARPWQNWIVMELLVAALLVVVFAIARSTFSVDKPGKFQHLLEVTYEFIKDTTDEIGIHHGAKYVPFFGALFIFILVMNLIGIIPAFESPTMNPAVPAGLAVCTFLYYNTMGIKENGLFKYLAHFAGPMLALAPLMIPIELISHLARPLTLTVRLYGNMFAGETVTNVFIRLTYLIGPVIFMALHVFVAFIQAYVFMLLAIIYVSGATAHEQ